MLSVHQRFAVVGATTATLTLLAAALPATATAGDGPDLSRFYHQKVTWTACEGDEVPKDLQCGKITVPLDYARPGAATLDLALARYKATGHSRGSVLLNFGGPGGAGIPGLAASGNDFMGLTNGYDVVTFDPRGVGRSSPVSCGDGADEIFGATATGTDVQAALKAVKKAADTCAAHSGAVLPHIGTVNAARDLDVMRQALGDKKLNYLGFSYGTRLGAVYAARFPKKTGRMVLDGVDTLTEPLTEQGLTGARGQQTALDDFITWCAKNLACPFGQDARSAGEQVVQLVKSLDAEPVPSDYGREFTGQDLVGAMGQALYSKAMWPVLEQALALLVQDGDPHGLDQLYGGASLPSTSTPVRHGPKHSGLVDAEDVPLDNLPAALMAINCADDPDRPAAGEVARQIAGLRAAYEEASPVFGRYRLAQVLMCYGRPKGTSYIRDKVRHVSASKMLLVGTRGDPATPYRWTEETARRLGSAAVVLDNRGEGHTGYASSKCVHRKVDDFLLYGSLPADGSSCGPENTDGTDG